MIIGHYLIYIVIKKKNFVRTLCENGEKVNTIDQHRTQQRKTI